MFIMWSSLWWRCCCCCLLVIAVSYSSSTVEASLLLTPYIDSNQIDTARQLSKIDGPSVLGARIPLSYSGHITVDKNLGNHLFFWFFRSQVYNTNTPLVVWLNGGPGVSSMQGVLHENGPLQMKKEGDRVVLGVRPFSWTTSFSMLYIDNPVGVGFSYSDSGSDGLKANQAGYTQDLYSFMEQFYQLFPEYMERELYIGGQSYAGKYVPSLAHYIHQEKQSGRSQLPLTGIYLGGPYFDPETQNCASVYLPYTLGIVSSADIEPIKTLCREIPSALNNKEGVTNEQLEKLVLKSSLGVGDNFVTEEAPPDTLLNTVMNDAELQRILHVPNMTFTNFNAGLFPSFAWDIITSTKPKLAVLLDNYKVLIYTGAYDGIVTAPMVEAGLMSTSWSGHAKYNTSSRTPIKINGKVSAYYTKTDKFCRVSVKAAGHQVPYDQPYIALRMMLGFVKSGCMA